MSDNVNETVKKKLGKLSAAFQKNAVKHMNVLRDPKIGFLQTLWQINALNKQGDKLEKELRDYMAYSSTVSDVQYSKGMSHYALMEALKMQGIDTSDFDKFEKAREENAKDPKYKEASTGVTALNTPVRLYKIGMAAKGKPQI